MNIKRELLTREAPLLFWHLKAVFYRILIIAQMVKKYVKMLDVQTKLFTNLSQMFKMKLQNIF
jgi:hypothetical protein